VAKKDDDKKPPMESSFLLESLPLAEQLNLKDRALSSSSEGITIADATKPDYPLIYVNKGFEELTGYSSEEACGTNCKFLQGEDTDNKAVETIRIAIRERRPCVVEILNYRKNGEKFWNRLSITPIFDNAGIVTHFVGIQSDVTARRRAEDELRIANTELARASDLIKKDLQFAADIQKSFLPSQSPSLNNIKATWELHPCDELAGDTLNIAAINERFTIFYLLDVSGHGVQAALLSVTLNRWLSPAANQLKDEKKSEDREEVHVSSPLEVIQKLNAQFPFDPNIGQYFTMIYGVFDNNKKEFHFVSAGHPPPIFLPKKGKPSLIETNNFPVGIVPDADFREKILKMESGDRLYLYSDGVVDATNIEGERFGQIRLLEEISHLASEPIDLNAHTIITRLEDWSGHNKFQDDVSFMGFEIE